MEDITKLLNKMKIRDQLTQNAKEFNKVKVNPISKKDEERNIKRRYIAYIKGGSRRLNR